MFRTLMKSKVHCVTGTQYEPRDPGSCTIDENLLDAAGIADNEEVHIFNIANGERFVTHAVRGARGTGMVAVNGPAARCAAVGDVVIIAALMRQHESAANSSRPKLLSVHDVERQPA